jgi:hypothetical protein
MLDQVCDYCPSFVYIICALADVLQFRPSREMQDKTRTHSYDCARRSKTLDPITEPTVAIWALFRFKLNPSRIGYPLLLTGLRCCVTSCDPAAPWEMWVFDPSTTPVIMIVRLGYVGA